MDYKALHGRPLAWTRDVLESFRYPEPYDICSAGQLKEINAPDGSSVFLMIHGYWDEASSLVVTYAVEAPSTCPIRMAFEKGDILWPEFWNHRGWLIRFSFNLFGGPVHAEYIKPEEIDQRTHVLLNHFRERSPFEIKRRQLESRWKYGHEYDADTKMAERQYRDFFVRHRDKFTLNQISDLSESISEITLAS